MAQRCAASHARVAISPRPVDPVRNIATFQRPSAVIAAAAPHIWSTLAKHDRRAVYWYYALTALVAVAVCLPIWFVEYPPLVDYPNHLARCYIFNRYGDEPLFPERYTFDATPIPSLGTDLFVGTLEHVVDVYTAGKLLLTLTLLLYFLGGHLLGRAIHGRPTWLALATALGCYHSGFFYGFTNYSLSLGMFLVALATWVGWWRHGGAARLALFQALVFQCYFTHLAGMLFVGAAVGLFSLWHGIGERRIGWALLGMLPLVPPTLLLFAFRPPLGADHDILWSSIAEKVIGSLCLIRTYNTTLDGIYLLVLLAVVAVLALSLRQIRADGAALLTGLVFVFLFVVGPKEIHGGGSPVDARMLPAAAPLLLVAPELVLRRRRAMLLLSALLGLIGLRIGIIISEWPPLSNEIAGQVELFAQVPHGATLYPIICMPEDLTERKRVRVLLHAAHYATVERHTYSPGPLAYPGQQPIRYRYAPTPICYDGEKIAAVGDVDWERVFREFEYVWGYQLPPDFDALLRQRCTVVAATPHGTIYRKK